MADQVAIENGFTTPADTFTLAGVGATDQTNDYMTAASTSSEIPRIGRGSSTAPVDGRRAPDTGPIGAAALDRKDPPIGGDSTGVTQDEIVLGVHLPLTGMGAAVPPTALRSMSLYWQYLKEQGRQLFGRDVRIVQMDDHSDPGTAVSVCREMVEQHDVFALVGLAGAHLMGPCAAYADSVGVPYIGGGGLIGGLQGLRTHFALWMPWVRQAPILADIMVHRLDARTTRNGLIRTNAATSIEPTAAIKTETYKRRVRFHHQRIVNITADYQEMENAALDMKQRDIQNIYLAGSPVHFTYFVTAAAKQDYYPQMIGPGLSVTFDTFLEGACKVGGAGDGALYLSSLPALRDSDDFDPEYRRAGGNNDFDWIGWGHMKTIAELLTLPGRDLTRERFIWFAERAETVKTGIYPPLRYTTTDHFAKDSMHLLRADCEKGRWVTDRAFLSPR